MRLPRISPLFPYTTALPIFREMVIFAPQNLAMDPPFTKLDILSCRNLLIYLAPDLQKRLVPLFHYSLNPGGTRDRKSTRLNSSHRCTSYAVFCLKKKKKYPR